jgi:hypothetical protein
MNAHSDADSVRAEEIADRSRPEERGCGDDFAATNPYPYEFTGEKGQVKLLFA